MAPCFDPAPLAEILARYAPRETSLIPVLQDVQRAYAYLPCEGLAAVSKTLGVPLAKVFSVVTFYRAFALQPQGRTVIKVCTGTACHIRGADRLLDELERRLAIAPGQTTPDFGFTLKTVNCVGACALAPVMILGERYVAQAKTNRLPALLDEGGHA
ncbi:MAG TPA: NAD(P)H-dependent oxidoreductase subunit E [Candidatus Baltobacteraceae bacterium]|nr:NAD(P)H-dependent oxidoreductase subunit E [Candidatus Baltobacteraceae bacterium]